MAHFIWPVMIEKHFSLPLTKVDIHFGHVRMYAMPYPIYWIIFILDLELLYRQIVGIPMGTYCAPLVADLFYTATNETSCTLLTMTIKLMLPRL